MKVALGALLMGLVALIGCSSDGDNQPTEVVTETVTTTETTEAQAVVDDMDKQEATTPMATTTDTNTDTKFVTTSLLNVRSGPGMSFGIVRVAQFKEKLAALESTGAWVKVGEGEYVAKAYLSDAEPSAPNDPAPKAATTEDTSAPSDTMDQGSGDTNE